MPAGSRWRAYWLQGKSAPMNAASLPALREPPDNRFWRASEVQIADVPSRAEP
jgi:hypothetical protein